MQIRSVFGQTETAHKLNVNVNPLSDSRWRFIWKSWITAVSRELRGWSSIAIKNTSFRYYMERRWKQNAIESFLKTVLTFRGTFIHSYIHLYNSLSTLLKPPAFPPRFHSKRNYSACCAHVILLLKTVLYAGQYLFIVSCSNHGNLIQF